MIIGGIFLKKTRVLFILFYMLCFCGELVQATGFNNEQFCFNAANSSPDSFDNNIRSVNKWKVEYKGIDDSRFISTNDVEGFKGSGEELELVVQALRIKRKHDFITKRNNLLDKVSQLLEEVIGNKSNTEFVDVKINDFGNEDYKLRLDYVYHAYDKELGSFRDEKSSRDESVCSLEQMISSITKFAKRHCEDMNCDKKNIIDRQPCSSPCCKKHRAELKQLSLEDSFKRSLKQRKIPEN